jgi:hypothetical protein
MRTFFFGLIAVLLGSGHPAHSEVAEITVAQQYGVSFLPLMVMEREGSSRSRDKRSVLPV